MEEIGVRANRTEGIALVSWPDERTRLEGARAAGGPRLVLVAAGAPPPVVEDPLEDWVRVPAPDGDVRARARTLLRRAASRRVPVVDVDTGLLRLGERRVTLSPVESVLASVLCEHFGSVVGRDTLEQAAWPGETPSRNVLDVHVLRLRRRLAPLDLEITTVRSRGYLLQATATSTV